MRQERAVARGIEGSGRKNKNGGEIGRLEEVKRMGFS
jgi:hypothetical protein